MEVKEFVKTILKEVTEAVEESTNEKHKFYMKEQEVIDFDLAVVSRKTEEGKVGAEVLGIGGKIQGSALNEIINRIKFQVHTYPK